MKTTALQKRATSLTEAAQGLTVVKGKLVPSAAFIDDLAAAIELESELAEFFGAIKQYMEVHKVTEWEDERGYLKLNKQRRLQADLKVTKPRFLTQTANTKAIRGYQELHQGKLPAGVKETVYNRLSKKVKELS